ncbi:hypothetical protein [Crossiella cryophila]|uniref:Uncharacterized protein n=1 Tax=Crossiella cryophila TaxID=43355 RepID=A0A7W7CDW0_9PSEU|nr:hypothetical protein [Crossiella cryophila]MBB4679319.1 hypothetical protein [Crossiella cryophila]
MSWLLTGAAVAALTLAGAAPASAAAIPVVQPLVFDSPGWRALPLSDRQLFTQFAHVATTFTRHAAGVWAPSFRPDRMPRVIGALPEGAGPGTRPRYAYAIGHPDPAKLGTATPVDLPRELGLPAVHRITDGPALDKLRDLPFYEVDDAAVVHFNYGTGASFDPGTWLLSRIDVHEAFHHFQSTFRPAVPGQPNPLDFPRGPAAVHALALLEDRVLAAPGPARERLRTFLAIRATRYAMVPAVVDLERQQDQWEGTARFAEDRYVELGGQTVVHEDQTPTDRRGLFFHFAGNRSYAVGTATGRLLEQLTGEGWRCLIAEGNAPADAAAKLVGTPEGADRERLIELAKQRHDYPALLARVTAADLPGLDLGRPAR